MNIRVAVCDDEKAQRDYLLLLTGKWSRARKITATVDAFDSAESFLFHYAGNKGYDILLLDVQMKVISGVGLAREIRGNNDGVQIVFITGYPDFMAEGYDVSALHYLLKPVDEGKFFDVLDKAVTRLRIAPRTILLSKKDGDVRIKLDDIIYAEVMSHTTTLYLLTGTEVVNMRITDIEKLLGDGFFRCHRSFIVSLRYVRRVTRTSVILEGGQEIPLSRNAYVEANKKFIEYN